MDFHVGAPVLPWATIAGALALTAVVFTIWRKLGWFGVTVGLAVLMMFAVMAGSRNG